MHVIRSLQGIVSAVVLMAGMASANLIVYEGFDYDAGGLAGENGGQGFSGAWSGGNVGSGGLSYTDSEGNALVVSGGHYSGAAQAFRTLETPFTSETEGVYWLTFLLRRDGERTSQSWGGLSLFPDDSNENLYMGLKVNSQEHRLVSYRPPPSATADTAAQPTLTDTTFFMAVRLEFGTESTSDKASLWVNPRLDIEPTLPPDAEVSSRDLFGSRFRIEAGDVSMSLDEIRLGTTWDSVAPIIPEPSTLILLGWGVLLMWRGFKKRDP